MAAGEPFGINSTTPRHRRAGRRRRPSADVGRHSRPRPDPRLRPRRRGPGRAARPRGVRLRRHRLRALHGSLPAITDECYRGSVARSCCRTSGRRDERLGRPDGGVRRPEEPAHHLDQLDAWAEGRLLPIVTDWDELSEYDDIPPSWMSRRDAPSREAGTSSGERGRFRTAPLPLRDGRGVVMSTAPDRSLVGRGRSFGVSNGT